MKPAPLRHIRSSRIVLATLLAGGFLMTAYVSTAAASANIP